MSRSLYGLLVGINDYPEPVLKLKGCVNDILLFKEYLENRVESQAIELKLQTLFDQQATRQAVIDGFKEHLSKAGRDDIVLFYYSGHGSQEPAPEAFWPMEPDHMNETLVLWDSRLTGGMDLSDKELSYLIYQAAQRRVHTLVVLDSCHSGSGTRDVSVGIRWAPATYQTRRMDSYELPEHFLQWLLEQQKAKQVGWLVLPESRHVLLAACQDLETAREYYADNQSIGVFSYFLRKTLQEMKGAISYREVIEQTKAQVMNTISGQTPQIEVSQSEDLNLPFLGGAVRVQPPFFFVRYDPGRDWVMEGGKLHGFPPTGRSGSCRLALFPLDADLSQKQSEAAHAVVYQMNTADALLEIDRSDQLDTTKVYKALVTGWPLGGGEVQFEGDPETLELVRAVIRRRNQDLSALIQVLESQASPLYRLIARDGNYQIKMVSGEEPISETTIQGYIPAQAEQVVIWLEHLLLWRQIVDLKNPASRLSANAIQVSVLLNQVLKRDLPILAEYHLENERWVPSRFRIKIENHSDQTLYVALLGLWENFSSEPLLPSGIVRIPPQKDGQPGELFTNMRIATVPDIYWNNGITERRDIYKVIACTRPFDLGYLKLSAMESNQRDVGISRVKEPPKTLGGMLHGVQMRESAEWAEDDFEDWITQQITMVVRRPLIFTPVSKSSACPLAPAVTLEPHQALSANARLTSLPQAQREVDLPLIPPVLQEAGSAFAFNATRGSDPGLSVLELDQVVNPQMVTSATPLILTIRNTSPAGYQVLPFVHDSEFFVPVGYSRSGGEQMQVIIQRLPIPAQTPGRDIKSTTRIFFQKIAAHSFGLPYPYPILAAVDFLPDGTLHYETDTDSIARRVMLAKAITIFIHGLLGDTRSMLEDFIGKPAGDLVLTFDYESINTSVKDTARKFRNCLAKVHLQKGRHKEVSIVAHSLGGIIARWYIEQEGGASIISRLVAIGTPNAGTPWSTVQQWATLGIGLLINSLSTVAWPVKALGMLVSAFETVDTTLDEIKPGSDVLKDLENSPDPNIPYLLIGGNTALIPQHLPAKDNTSIGRFLARFEYGLGSLPFFMQPNDMMVSLYSSQDVSTARKHRPIKIVIPADHSSYFNTEAGCIAVQKALTQTIE